MPDTRRDVGDNTMSTFVHITDARNRESIRRNGLRARGQKQRGRPMVYLTPRLPNFVHTHQWVRELKRWHGSATMIAVDIVLPDDEPVLVGHFGRGHRDCRAAEAVALIGSLADPAGYQVAVSRPLLASEIRRIRAIPQGVGWRYYPGAHGNSPCGCPICVQPGTAYGRRGRRS